MRLRNMKNKDNQLNLEYTNLKDTSGGVLKTYSKRGRTKIRVGQLIHPPARYNFDHSVKLDPILEEGVENSPVDWNDLRKKAIESRKFLINKVMFNSFRKINTTQNKMLRKQAVKLKRNQYR